MRVCVIERIIKIELKIQSHMLYPTLIKYFLSEKKMVRYFFIIILMRPL